MTSRTQPPTQSPTTRPAFRRAFTLVCLVAAAVAAPLAHADPLASARNRPIQPGAPVVVNPGPEYPQPVRDTPFGVCTLNFVFRGTDASHEPGAGHGKQRGRPDRGGELHTYIGNSGHCVQQVGERVAIPGMGEFGTVVFKVGCRPVPCEPQYDDFSLIRIDSDKLDLVSPVVRGLGTAPTGYLEPSDAQLGDVVFMHQQGAPFTLAEPGRSQSGLLEAMSPEWFASTLIGPASSGSPVVRQSDGKAVGVMAYGRRPQAVPDEAPEQMRVLSSGPTIGHILQLLAAAGVHVELVTAS